MSAYLADHATNVSGAAIVISGAVIIGCLWVLGKFYHPKK